MAEQNEHDDDDFPAYTRQWTDKINRGGLFPLNHGTFKFLRRVLYSNGQRPAAITGAKLSEYFAAFKAEKKGERYAIIRVHSHIYSKKKFQGRYHVNNVRCPIPFPFFNSIILYTCTCRYVYIWYNYICRC